MFISHWKNIWFAISESWKVKPPHYLMLAEEIQNTHYIENMEFRGAGTARSLTFYIINNNA